MPRCVSHAAERRDVRSHAPRGNEMHFYYENHPMMISAPSAPLNIPTGVRCLYGEELANRLPHLEAWTLGEPISPLGRHPRWLKVLEQSLGHSVYMLEAFDGDRTTGVLPLAFVHSYLFGRYLVSLPYLNSNGVVAADEETRRRVIERAVQLADELQVRHLELRHEQAVEHPALNARMDSKVHMRLKLPDFPGPLWEQLPAKVRNQVRKGEKSDLKIEWGGVERLDEFYAVFSRNMRDLGTPVYGRSLFASILRHFPNEAELCVVRQGDAAVAAALLLHGRGVTEVPSASSLREYNSTCANMFMYWNLLERAVRRGQGVFDFGRSTVDGGTYKFKKQWGAVAEPAVWQYYVRDGDAGELRPDNPRYQRLIRLWQRLPVRLTRWIGPSIVRGIP
jgi:serine/alanine adding enzyme